MTLAVMLSTDEDAFVCDMAETYHVMDYRALPVSTLAVLASGLRDNSRIKMQIAGMRHVPIETLAAHCVDTLALILYVIGAQKGAEKPKSMLDIMRGIEEPKKDIKGFLSGADFEAEKRRLLGG